jgi:transcriptional regulator with XRE-family HTH domain
MDSRKAMTEDELNAKMEDLRRALAERREAVGLTTREVASKAGMKSNTNVSYLENHSTFAVLKDLYRLAAVYDVELPDLAEAFRASTTSNSSVGDEPPPARSYPPVRPYRGAAFD